jgi:hypothetical protein
MKPMAGNLAIAGAALLFGTIGGVTLGNFVAAGGRVSGAEELAAYFSESGAASSTHEDEFATAPIQRSGPTSYECEGCDAKLHPEPEVPDVSDYLPLPSYEVLDLPVPPRRDEPSVTPPLAAPRPGDAQPVVPVPPDAPGAPPPVRLPQPIP